MEKEDELIPLAVGQNILKYSHIEKFPSKREIISGRLLWTEEQCKAILLGVLTAKGLNFLINDILPEKSLEELREILDMQ